MEFQQGAFLFPHSLADSRHTPARRETTLLATPIPSSPCPAECPARAATNPASLFLFQSLPTAPRAQGNASSWGGQTIPILFWRS